MAYSAPVGEIVFLLQHVIGIDRFSETERFSDIGADMLRDVLEEAGKLATDVAGPLNRVSDNDPARLENGVVVTTQGFKEAYRSIAEGGWIGIAAKPEYGGMGLPQVAAQAVNEMMSGACLSLSLCPLLSQGQIDALEHHASDEIKALYLPKLISGEWTGTMNLTESQAGTDVGALRTKAEPSEDGTYRITGQKIYISWGDHDVAENISHLVLARLPDSPSGTRGLSLFVVPKFIPDSEGRPGIANDLRPVSLEHKLGLHGSPTAVMSFEGAKGWLVGEQGGGMAAMFTMMNNARLGVGVEGLGIAEAACQKAAAYASEREQGGRPIASYPDVRRMLLTMRALTDAARGICLDCAFSLDMARATGSEEWLARGALLTPIAKAFGTDTGCEVASLGIQVHGGMGYIEETGAAQLYRDVRVTAIYEGTNGIQAMDLVGRKLADGGDTALDLLSEVRETAKVAHGRHASLARILEEAANALGSTTLWMVDADMKDRNAGATPYLRAFALTLGGHYLLRAALADEARVPLARFFIRQLLPSATALAISAEEGAAALEAAI